MKELHFIISEKEKNRKCMDCTWFKTDPNDLPDFGKCIINHCDVISSDRACADFAYPKGGKEIIGKELIFMKGKVSDICTKCKNCKSETRESNGVHVWLTEVECEDPYDGMTKTLDADSDICCSMFEERKEKEPFNLNMPREAIKAIAKLNDVICELEKEKADHLKGIERLKKSQEKLQNQVKNLQTTNEESYKREEKLEDKCHKLERRLLEENKRFERLDTEFLIPLAHVLYPREAKIYKPYSEVLTDIKLLNKDIYDLEEDNKRLADKNKALFEENLDRLDKHTKQCQEIDDLKNELKKANELADYDKRCKEECEKKYRDEISKLQNIVTEKEVEIKGLKKEIINLSFDRITFKDVMKRNIKFKETISDQEVTIKAMLITIKEMCKEDETNA